MRAHREVVREFLSQERASVACLVETKLDVLSQAMANDLMGIMYFDYVLLPSVGASGGVVVAWRRDVWTATCRVPRQFSVLVTLLPVSTVGALQRLRRAEKQSLIDSVAARIPTWKAGLLTDAGRALLTKVTLSAIPVHVSIACCLSQWAISQIDRRRRAFLWAGADTVSGGKCKVAWTRACRPTTLGGLGIVDLRFFGFALRLRWEWLRRTEPECCWALLPARHEPAVAVMAAISMSVVHGDGMTALFWTDSWSSLGPLCRFAPHLFAATSRPGRRRTLKDATHHNRWARDIVGALTTQVLCQFLRVWELTRSVMLDPLQPDRFVWKRSADGHYSVSSTYRAFFAGSTALLGARELWRARAPPKVKFFGWLALHNRLWTAARRKRHGMQDSEDCAFCGQAPETVEHLILGCVFARQLWHTLLSPLGLDVLVPAQQEDFAVWWLHERKRIDKASRPTADSLILLVAWNLRKHRNGVVFCRYAAPDLTRVRNDIVQEAEEWVEAGYLTLGGVSASWSQHRFHM